MKKRDRTLTPTLVVSSDDNDQTTYKTTPPSERVKRRKAESPVVPHEAVNNVRWKKMDYKKYRKMYSLESTHLGGGAYGQVFRVKRLTDNKNVALKIFTLKSGGKVLESAAREVAALDIIARKAKNNEVQQYLPKSEDHFYIDQKDIRALAMQERVLFFSGLISNADLLFDSIKEERTVLILVTRFETNAVSIRTLRKKPFGGFKTFSNYELLLVCVQFLRALKFLHDNRIYHLDIHEENVMIVYAPYVPAKSVLIDFGLACSNDPSGSEIACSNFKRLTDKNPGYDDIDLANYDLKSTYEMFLNMVRANDKFAIDVYNLIYKMKTVRYPLDESLAKLETLLEKYKEKQGVRLLLNTLWNTAK